MWSQVEESKLEGGLLSEVNIVLEGKGATALPLPLRRVDTIPVLFLF